MVPTPWKENLEDVRPYVPGKSVEELKRTLGLDNVIKMASNESDSEPPASVLEAVRHAAREMRTYPDSRCPELRARLAAKYGVGEANFIFGNGSDEVIVMAARAFLDGSAEVLVPDPTFLYYDIVSSCEGAKIRKVPLDRDLRVDVDKLIAALNERTRLIFLSNPNNPTGSMIFQEELERLIEALDERTVLFLDEAYYEYVDEERRPVLYEQLERKDRVIIISRTFSKAYALAGLRIGYGMMREDVREALDKVRPPFNVNTLAQAAACAALECEDHFLERVKAMKARVAEFSARIDDMGLLNVKSHTNFVLMDTARPAGAVAESLLEKGIIVRDMAAWGLGGFLRVNLSHPEHNARLLKALEEALEEIPATGEKRG